MRFDDDVPMSVVKLEMRSRMPSAWASSVVRSGGTLPQRELGAARTVRCSGSA